MDAENEELRLDEVVEAENRAPGSEGEEIALSPKGFIEIPAGMPDDLDDDENERIPDDEGATECDPQSDKRNCDNLEEGGNGESVVRNHHYMGEGAVAMQIDGGGISKSTNANVDRMDESEDRAQGAEVEDEAARKGKVRALSPNNDEMVADPNRDTDGTEGDPRHEPPKKKRKTENVGSGRKATSTGRSAGSDGAIPPQKSPKQATANDEVMFPKIEVVLPPPPRKLGLTLEDDEQHWGLPLLVNLKPKSPLRSAIPADIVGDSWIVGIRDSRLGEAKTLSSSLFLDELNARRRKGEETVVELSFVRRGAARSTLRPRQPQSSAGEVWVEPSRQLQQILLDQQQGQQRLLQQTAEQESRQHRQKLENHQLQQQQQMQMFHHHKQQLQQQLEERVWMQQQLAAQQMQAGLTAASGPPGMTGGPSPIGNKEDLEASEGKVPEATAAENGEEVSGGKMSETIPTDANIERQGECETKPGPVNRSNAGFGTEERADELVEKSMAVDLPKAGGGKAGDGVFRQDGSVARLMLNLPPPPQKLGLVFQDDAAHYGMPMLMGLSPDSPFKSVIPSHIFGRYLITSIWDEEHGWVKVTNGSVLRSELTTRRKDRGVTSVHFLFALIGTVPPSLSADDADATAAMVRDGALPPLRTCDLPWKPRARDSKGAGKKGGDRGKESRDETVRRALSEFFSEGETRSLKQFCDSYSKVYSTLCTDIKNDAGLRALGEKRKAGTAFTKEDSEAALVRINQIFSEKFNSKKRKSKTLDPMKDRKRPHLPPLNTKGECKGLQSKDVDRFYADDNRSNVYLYETGNLSHFRGWRHKDCPLIAELDIKGRCKKCFSAYTHLSRSHPKLFKKFTPPTMAKSLLPRTNDIILSITKRLEALEADAVPNDPQLEIAAKVMKLKGKSSIELGRPCHGGNKLFHVCEECGKHSLRRNMLKTTRFCRACQAYKSMSKKNLKRAEMHKEQRVQHDSHIPLNSLTRDEVIQRYQNLKTVYKELARKAKSLEKKEAVEKVKAEQQRSAAPDRKSTPKGRQYRTPLMPWPYYLNYNPTLAQEYEIPTSALRATAPAARGAKPEQKRPAANDAKPEQKRPAANDGTKSVDEDAAEGDPKGAKKGNPGFKGGERQRETRVEGEEGVVWGDPPRLPPMVTSPNGNDCRGVGDEEDETAAESEGPDEDAAQGGAEESERGAAESDEEDIVDYIVDEAMDYASVGTSGDEEAASPDDESLAGSEGHLV